MEVAQDQRKCKIHNDSPIIQFCKVCRILLCQKCITEQKCCHIIDNKSFAIEAKKELQNI